MQLDTSLYGKLDAVPKVATLGEIAAAKNKALKDQLDLLTSQQNLQKGAREEADAKRKAEGEQAVRDAYQRFNGPDGVDRGAMLDYLTSTGHGDMASDLAGKFSKLDKDATDSRLSELDKDDKVHNYVADALERADADTYPLILPSIRALDPDVANFLGDTYDPAKVQTALHANRSREAYNQKYAAVIKRDDDAETQALNLIALAPDAKEYADAWDFARFRGVAGRLRAQGFSDQFTPDAAEKAKRAVLGVKGIAEEADKATGREIAQGNLDVARGNLAVRRQEAAQGGAGAAGGAVPILDPNAPHGDAYLQTLPSTQQAMVKALAEGRQPWPSSFALKTPYWQTLMQQVFQYDPTFDTASASNNARVKVRQDFTSGKSAQQVNALNTVIGHLGTLSDASSKLNNTNNQWVNAAKNWLKTVGGSSAVTNFETAKEAVASELVRVWRQAGGASQDIQDWKKTIDAANSPAQLNEAFATIGHLLESKMESMQEQYQQGMGISSVRLVTPAARSALDKLEGAKPSAPTEKVVTTAQLAAIAKKNGTTVEQERTRATDAGYVVR